MSSGTGELRLDHRLPYDDLRNVSRKRKNGRVPNAGRGWCQEDIGWLNSNLRR